MADDLDVIVAELERLKGLRDELGAHRVVATLAASGPTRDAMIDHYTVEVISGERIFAASAQYPKDAYRLAVIKAREHAEAKVRKAKNAQPTNPTPQSDERIGS